MSAAPEHTLGPKCRLAPVERATGDDGMPPIEAQFFYSSVIPIDDPLSTSASTASSDTRSNKNQLRPFARGDNNALDKAWLSLASDQDRCDHDDARHHREQAPEHASAATSKRALLVEGIAKKHLEKHRGGFSAQEVALPVSDGLPTTPMPACCTELLLDVSEALEWKFCALVRRFSPDLDPEMVAQAVVNNMTRLRQSQTTARATSRPTSQAASSRRPASYHDPPSESPHRPLLDKRRLELDAELKRRPRSISQLTNTSSRTQTPVGSPPVRPPPADDGISGKPFIRVGSEDMGTSPSAILAPKLDSPTSPRAIQSPAEPAADAVQALREMEMDHAGQAKGPDDKEIPDNTVEVSVGVSRLHMVSLPMLQMKPIYWSPVNDMAVVVRATWFYRYDEIGAISIHAAC